MKAFKSLLVVICFPCLLQSQNMDSLFYSDNDTSGLYASIIDTEVKFIRDFDKTITKVGINTHQLQIINFINKNIGKRINGGICWELINESYKQWDKKWFSKSHPYGELINRKDIHPGDVIVTSGGVTIDGSGFPSHIMFVYEIDSKGTIWVAHQNVNAKTLKDSKVVITEFDFNTWIASASKITIKCYRAR